MIAAVMQWCARRGFAVAVLVLCAAASWSGAQVLVVRNVPGSYYRELGDAVAAELAPLRNGQLTVDVVDRDRFVADGAKVGGREFVIALGFGACNAVLDAVKAAPAPPPVLCVAVTDKSFQRIAGRLTEGRDRRATALFIGQPIARQLDLLRVAVPDRMQVGVLFGPDSEDLQQQVREAAAKRALTLHTAVVQSTSDVFAAMQKVLAESNVFLALPNPVTINDLTAYSVLRTSYSASVPVLGFSQSMVRAGALLGVFTDASQYARESAGIVRRFMAKDAGLPPADYPALFTVGVNQSVARSLGLRLPGEAELAAALAVPRKPQ